MNGTFAHAVCRDFVARSPMDRLAPTEKPKQRNAKRIAVLDTATIDTLVMSAASERWRAAVGIAGYAGLRLGEIRALTWADIDLEANTLKVRRSLLPDGTPKSPKTDAGVRTVPILPALRRLLVALKLRTSHACPDNFVIGTARGGSIDEASLRRALGEAKKVARLDDTEERLSWHSLRHSFASMLATDLELPATTLARLTGHKDAGFTLKVYARDARDDGTVTADVLVRAAGAGVGE